MTTRVIFSISLSFQTKLKKKMNIKFLITLFILVVCTRAVQSTNRKTQRNSIYSIKSVVGRICSDVRTMKEKMTGLEMENDELQEKVKDLDDDSHLEVKIDNLETKCSALEMKVSHMELENDEQQKKINDLEMKVSDLEIENKEQQMKIDNLEQIGNQPGKVAIRKQEKKEKKKKQRR